MAQFTKWRCDTCHRETSDVYLEPGWIRIGGSITRSWGRRAGGTTGDAQSDFIDGSSEYCSLECMLDRLDKIRAEKKGPVVPRPKTAPPAVLTDGPDPLKPKPWEDPIGDELDLSPSSDPHPPLPKT